MPFIFIWITRSLQFSISHAPSQDIYFVSIETLESEKKGFSLKPELLLLNNLKALFPFCFDVSRMKRVGHTRAGVYDAIIRSLRVLRLEDFEYNLWSETKYRIDGSAARHLRPPWSKIIVAWRLVDENETVFAANFNFIYLSSTHHHHQHHRVLFI